MMRSCLNSNRIPTSARTGRFFMGVNYHHIIKLLLINSLSRALHQNAGGDDRLIDFFGAKRAESKQLQLRGSVRDVRKKTATSFVLQLRPGRHSHQPSRRRPRHGRGQS